MIRLVLLFALIVLVSVHLHYAQINYKESYYPTFSFEKHDAQNPYTELAKFLKNQEKLGKSVQIACWKNDDWYSFVSIQYYGYPDSNRWALDPNNPSTPTADYVFSCNSLQMKNLNYKKIDNSNIQLSVYTKI